MTSTVHTQETTITHTGITTVKEGTMATNLPTLTIGTRHIAGNKGTITELNLTVAGVMSVWHV